MPFDATVAIPQRADPLRQLGVIPVDDKVVKAHKASVIEAFCSVEGTVLGECIAANNRRAVQTGIAYWRQIVFSRHEICDKLRLFHQEYRYTPDHSAAPRALIKLADYVAKRLEESVFVVEYFYTDPILYVVYDQRTACLGIWDKGKLLDIATYPSWWSRLWR